MAVPSIRIMTGKIQMAMDATRSGSLKYVAVQKSIRHLAQRGVRYYFLLALLALPALLIQTLTRILHVSNAHWVRTLVPAR